MNISGISSYWGFYDYNSIQSEESDKTGGGASPIAKQSGMPEYSGGRNRRMAGIGNRIA